MKCSHAQTKWRKFEGIICNKTSQNGKNLHNGHLHNGLFDKIKYLLKKLACIKSRVRALRLRRKGKEAHLKIKRREKGEREKI